MAITMQCDYCGREIEQGQAYVTMSVDGEHSDRRWTSGYVGQYHARGRKLNATEQAVEHLGGGRPRGGADCWAEIDSAVRLVHEWGPTLETIPTATGQAIAARRRKHVLPKCCVA